MSASIPNSHLDLLTEPVVVTLVTLMPDYQPQATPVWCSFDGTHIWVNTAAGRQKDKNMRNRPRVTILALDPQNPYRYLEVRGVVQEINEEQGLEHINSLSVAYRGYEDFYKNMPDLRGNEQRVVFKIKPEHVITGG